MGLAAALVFAPGVALAAPGVTSEGAPADPTELIEELLDGAAGESGPAPEAADPASAPAPAELPDPAELLAELGTALGLSQECVTGVQEALETTAGGLTGLPAELQALLAEFQTGLQAALESQDPAAVDAFLDEVFGTGDEPADAPLPLGQEILAGLEELAATLPACLPAPPTDGGTPTPGPTTPPAATPTPQPPAATPHAPAPVAQPVAYLGYAPTGADSARADDTSVPLTALAGGLLLVGAGAAGYGMRGRAVPTRD
jgi:hypothetical protein